MKPKISIITLGVADFKKSKEFYCRLGFSLHGEESESYAIFELEGTWLALFPRDKLAEDAQVSPEGHGFSGITLAHNVASKEEVDQTINQLHALGVTVVKEPTEVFWGGYSGYFSDPDGYLWEVAFNPFTDLS